MYNHLPFNIGNTTVSEGAFPIPWADYSSVYMPTSLREMLLWAQFIVSTNSTYSSAIERIVSYFVTEVEISDTDEAGKQQYRDFLHNTLGIQSHLKTIGKDFLTYGNEFISIIEPLYRTIYCQKCKFEAPIKSILNNKQYNFKFSHPNISAYCPHCKTTTPWTQKSQRTYKAEHLQLKRWNPLEMLISWCPYSEHTSFIWQIPEYFRQAARRGDSIILSDTPWPIIEAAISGDDLMFFDDEIFHLKEPALAGHYNRGWGISRVMTHFRHAWYLSVLHRHNEGIALDYMMPLRIISPAPGGGLGGDPIQMLDMGGWAAKIQNMISERRRDPTRWFTSPYPIQYQFVGAEGSNMVPFNLMEFSRAELLDAIGIPVQLYRADMSVQTGATAARLLEMSWSHLVFLFNRFLQWLVDKLSVMMGWDRVKAKMVKPSLADDLNRQLARLQLMGMGVISKTTALQPLGIDYMEEMRKSLEEQRIVAEEAQKVQEEMANIGLGDALASGQVGGAVPQAMEIAGGPLPSNMAGGAQNNASALPTNPADALLAQLKATTEGQKLSPEEIDYIAQTLAAQIYQMSSTMRISTLRKLKNMNPTIHAVVKSVLDNLDANAEQQGKIVARQVAQQAAMQAVQPPI